MNIMLIIDQNISVDTILTCIACFNIRIFISPDTQIKRLLSSNISTNNLRVRFFTYMLEKNYSNDTDCKFHFQVIPRTASFFSVPSFTC